MSTCETRFRRPTRADIRFVAETMRDDDIVEVAMSNELSPFDAIERGIQVSDWAATAVSGGHAIAILGVAPVNTFLARCPKGSPWLLGSTLLHKNPRPLLVDFPRVIYAMLQKFPLLENYAFEGSKANIRWLRHVGFTVHEAAEMPGYPGRFHRFTMGE